jgi:hypothetical protein
VSSETLVPWNELIDFENGTISPAEVRIGREPRVLEEYKRPLARNFLLGEMDFGASPDILDYFGQLLEANV